MEDGRVCRGQPRPLTEGRGIPECQKFLGTLYVHAQSRRKCNHILHGSQTLSFRFNGHCPGDPGLAGFNEAKDDGSGGDNWSYRSCKAPQSNHHHQRTNIRR